MEKGFYHPTRGYWQTIGAPSADMLASYPEGTVEVSLPPAGMNHYDGAAWVYVEPPVEVPQRVTRRQARQALLLNSKLSLVQPAIDAIEDATQRAMMQIEWDDSQEFERHRPSLIAIGAALGLDDAAIDALFVQAAAL